MTGYITECWEIPEFYGDLRNVSIQSIIKSRDIARICADLKEKHLVMLFVSTSGDRTRETQETVTWDATHCDGHNLALIESLEKEAQDGDESLFGVLLMPNPRSYYESCDQLKDNDD